jgi:hypothetical protein
MCRVTEYGSTKSRVFETKICFDRPLCDLTCAPTPGAWRCSSQSFLPHPSSATSPPTVAPANSRNRRKRVAVCWRRARRFGCTSAVQGAGKRRTAAMTRNILATEDERSGARNVGRSYIRCPATRCGGVAVHHVACDGSFPYRRMVCVSPLSLLRPKWDFPSQATCLRLESSFPLIRRPIVVCFPPPN